MENIETKTAHWVDRTDWLGTLAIYKYACSNCGFTIGHKPFSRADGKGDKYCAECGAKMSTEVSHKQQASYKPEKGDSE